MRIRSWPQKTIAEIQPVADEAHLVPDVVRDERCRRVVEDDRFVAVEPALALVDLGLDPLQVQGRDQVAELTVLGVEDLALPGDEVDELLGDVGHLVSGW